LETHQYTCPLVPSTWNQNPHLDSQLSQIVKSTGSADRNQSRDVAVPFGIFRISVGTTLKYLQYPLPQVPSTENKNPQLESLVPTPMERQWEFRQESE